MLFIKVTKCVNTEHWFSTKIYVLRAAAIHPDHLPLTVRYINVALHSLKTRYRYIIQAVIIVAKTM